MKTTLVGENSQGGFREFLKRRLAERCAANPQYSLRAFAKALKTDHSTLSQWLRGKRRITPEAIRGLAPQLDLSEDETEQFVAYESHLPVNSAERYERQLQAEAAQVICGWHHFAILELTKLSCFRPDSHWIARVPDIPIDEVNVAIARLLHLELLEMVDETSWRDCSPDACSKLNGNAAEFAKELASRVRRFTRPPQPDGSILSTSTIAVDRTRLPIALAYLERIRREIADLLAEDDRPCDDVYQLDLFLYPVTTLFQENDNGPARDAIPNPRQEPRESG